MYFLSYNTSYLSSYPKMARETLKVATQSLKDLLGSLSESVLTQHEFKLATLLNSVFSLAERHFLLAEFFQWADLRYTLNKNGMTDAQNLPCVPRFAPDYPALVIVGAIQPILC